MFLEIHHPLLLGQKEDLGSGSETLYTVGG